MTRAIVVLISLVGLLAGVYFAGRSAGKDAVTAKWNMDKVVQARQAVIDREKYAKLYTGVVTRLAQEDQEKDNALAALHRDYVGVLDSLRSRPSRADLPATTQAPDDQQGRPGADGTQLYVEDGRFLAGEAARADELRIALHTCYKQYDIAAGVK